MRGKIGYVLLKYPISTQTFLVRELLELERQGIEIHIFSLLPPDPDQWTPEHKKLRAQVTYISPSNTIIRPRTVIDHFVCLLRRPLKYLSVLRWVFLQKDRYVRRSFFIAPSFMRALRTDRKIVQLHAYFANIEAAVALIAHRLTGMPFSFGVHSSDLYQSPKTLCVKAKEAIFVSVISEYNRKMISDQCGIQVVEKVHVIHCGVALADFERVLEARQRIQFQGGAPFRILTVARLIPVKGYRELVNALSILQKKGREFRWIVMGDGPLDKDLREWVDDAKLKNWVEFMGAVPNSKVLEALKEVDCFVLSCIPSTSSDWKDGIPVSLIEAMAAGVPVISTRLSGIPELIEHDYGGLLVEPGDSQSLADAISLLMDKPDLRERLAWGGRSKVIQEFEIESNTARLAQLFEQHSHSGYCL